MQFKKYLVLAASVSTISFLAITNLRAADAPPSDEYLKVIAQNTTNILAKVDTLPAYIEEISKYITNWQKEDDSTTTSEMQANFSAIGSSYGQNLVTQYGQQTQVAADVVGLPVADFTSPTDNPKILSTFGNINNISYASMLGAPPAPKGQTSLYEYVKNASALNFKEELPGASWGGSAPAQLKYQAYFNSISAIKSYDAFILSGFMAEAQNGFKLTAAQNKLLTQATDSQWLIDIAAEELGKVLRQILMFQSQSYVLLTQQLQIQKQQLAATAMSNSLLIMNSHMIELHLKGRAQNKTVLE